MSGFVDTLLGRRRLIVATTLLLALTGVSSWLTMPREEDPQFPKRDGSLVTPFPGADAETVERLVVEPLEEYLAEVEEVVSVNSTARAGVAILHIEMNETVYATDEAWDDVREAIDKARREFPAGVFEPELDDDLISQEAIAYAVTGSSDPLVLLDAAERAKRRLLALDSVKEVQLVADPGEQITVEYDDAVARRLGVDPASLGRQLNQRSSIVPGGLIHLGAKTATLKPETEFRSLDEIRNTPVLLPSGSSVPLGELARVRRGPQEPPAAIMRWNGEPAVGVSLVPQDNIDRVRFGQRVREEVAALEASLDPLRLEPMIFQPDLVEARLADLTGSLQLGILIVAAVLFLVMGLRLGVVVATVVPLVAMGAIALFAAGGGILHQISIASIVIALGMLVDNAIVVAENIQYRLDRGLPVRQAAVRSVKELALPLGTATGTTLAAFVPMLISKGNTADFTRSIPVLIMLTLTVSYVFAILVTPVLSELLLRPRAKTDDDRSRRLASGVARLAVGRPGLVLLGAVALLGLTVVTSRWVDVKFFPAADRATVVVELEMPEGTHLEATDVIARRVEDALLGHEDVATVGTFVGRNGPKFYYNLLTQPQSPHRAMLIVDTHTIEDVEPMIGWVRNLVARDLPEASVVARRLEQGPPIEAPLEVRVMGYDLEDMEDVADRVLAEMRAVPGTRDVRHDLGLGVPTVVFEIDDAAAGRQGLSRVDVARALLGRTLGAEVGQYRQGEDPVPILVRSSSGEQFPAADLATIDVPAPGGRSVPLAQVAELGVEWRPAAIYHRDRSRVVKVQAQLAEGLTAHGAFTDLEPRLAALELPDGVRLEMGGELEESGKANAAILGKMPLGLMLLLFFLLLEFNSFRRLGIVMVTVPLAAVGVVPGLILSGQPFGFMSMLGVISLVGIVVNNAIVLLDVIETNRREGASIDVALEEAVRRRTRPILLTMATTVAGLSPLAFSEATLWPPLAWAMISGLMASTVLTLLVIPALYKLLFDRGSFRFLRRGGPQGAPVAAALLLMLGGTLWTSTARAEGTLTLDAAMERAADRPASAAAALRADAADRRAVAERRAALWPSVGVTAGATRRDRDFEFDTPLGGFTLGDRTSTDGAIQVVQPIFDPARLRFG
ncbi:MAG: efflux RND transporter permease subunit, partial [Acidobacteriota bacterium]